jgi:hypothetical protein
MVRPPRNDRTLQIARIGRELSEEEWTDEDTLVEVPKDAPAHVRWTLPFLLALPPRHRAALALLAVVVGAGVVVYLIATGHVPAWLR